MCVLKFYLKGRTGSIEIITLNTSGIQHGHCGRHSQGPLSSMCSLRLDQNYTEITWSVVDDKKLKSQKNVVDLPLITTMMMMIMMKIMLLMMMMMLMLMMMMMMMMLFLDDVVI